MVLQHGTVLLDVDARKMFSLLKVPDEKIRDKMISAAEERVTSANRELGTTIPFETAKSRLISAFELGTTKSGKLSEKELADARRLSMKYSSKDWNFMR
jgi:lipoate-protein ligase A